MQQRSTEDYRQAICRWFPDDTYENDVLRETALYLLEKEDYTAELGRVGQHLADRNLSPKTLGLGLLQDILEKHDVFRVFKGPKCGRRATLLVYAFPGYLFVNRQPAAAATQHHHQQQSATNTHKRDAEVENSAHVENEAKRQRMVCPSLIMVDPQSSTAALQTAQTTAARDTTIRAGIALSAALAAGGAADQQAAASAVAHVQQQLTVSASSRDVERMRLMSSMFEFGTAMVKAGAAPDKVMQLLDEARGLITSSSSSSGGYLNINGVSNGCRTLGQ